MSRIDYAQINDEILAGLAPPRRSYFLVLALLAGGIAWMIACWVYQNRMGMGVAGLNRPVGWAVYITNFVFWIGIAHSGTLISAILHLVRSRWRVAVSRAAEAMTVFAVMTAGLFPLIHLGRLWVFYYILPYPSQRQLWPDFLSPLVWDVVAVSTYFTVSGIFWYVGMLPDLAAARDRCHALYGPAHWRTRLYRRIALGWSGAGRQWRHFGRSYLFFAALATPLVISVHSVVSWDFAVSLLPGWHTTIFAPYFVAGAIHSGLAMVLTLLIPMRRLLRLENVLRIEHFAAVAKVMLVTTIIVGYAYVIEHFISWYSGDLFERQFTAWRAGEGWITPMYWSLWVLNVLAPLAFLAPRVRRSLAGLFIVSILVNLGMWSERFVIIVGSLSHDFLPHNWRPYAPTWVELSITGGAFAFFLFWFVCFCRMLPVVSISDVKEDRSAGSQRYHELDAEPVKVPLPRRGAGGVLGIFADREALLAALRQARDQKLGPLETYAPVRLREAEALLGRGPSPVRYWTLAGALTGCAGGFALAIGSALVNGLIVGGKHPVSIIPYCVIAFECTVLLGTLGNLAGLMHHSRLGRPGPLGASLPAGYDRRFSRDRFGLLIACAGEQARRAEELLAAGHAQEIRVVPARA